LALRQTLWPSHTGGRYDGRFQPLCNIGPSDLARLELGLQAFQGLLLESGGGAWLYLQHRRRQHYGRPSECSGTMATLSTRSCAGPNRPTFRSSVDKIRSCWGLSAGGGSPQEPVTGLSEPIKHISLRRPLSSTRYTRNSPTAGFWQWTGRAASERKIARFRARTQVTADGAPATPDLSKPIG
jgi:hypothetical protein